MINIKDFLNGEPLKEMDDYYTNGEFLIKKDLCTIDESVKIEKLDMTLEKLLGKYSDKEYEAKGYSTLTIAELYKDLIIKISDLVDIEVLVAGKYDPIKFISGDDLIALIMPMQIKLSAEQERLLMVNNFMAYCEYKALIPVEYKLENEEGYRGIFACRYLNDAEIKKMIKRQVKHHGGRWMGKFQRKPELLKEYAKMASEQLNNCDKGRILSDMNKALNKEDKA